MTVKVIDQKNLAAGLLFLLLGLAVAFASSGYSLGTPRRMGPGFFPLGVGAALALVGLIVLAGALRNATASALGPFRINAVAFIVLAVLAFAFLLKSMGVVIATVALIGISAFANPKRSWSMVLASIGILVPLCWLIFVALLGLRLRMLPPFLGVPGRMELLDNILLGFHTALSATNLLYAFLGCLLGTLIGVLPGIGPLATISMLLPFTYGLDPTTALIMLAGIYYGAAYGGSTTAILVNLPGETSSVVTVIDGYKMAQQGRAGVAITTAAIGSFVAGCFGTLLLAAFARPLTEVALSFGGTEYFSLMVLGLVGAVSLSSGSTPKAIGMILLGIVLGLVGTDITSGVDRFTFDVPELFDGINFIVVAVGVFAFGEVVASLEHGEGNESYTQRVGSLLPQREDFRRMTPSIVRGTAVGSIMGVLPGAGMSIASFLSYSLERRVSRFRQTMGKGAIEGVAGPESANNAAAQTAFIPTLTLGIPGNATMALMLGAMIMHNIQPGPQVITRNPDLFWGLVVSMWIGNAILVILNLPLVGIWVRLLRVPYGLLFPAILLFSLFGIYGSELSVFDLYMAAGFGLAGYVFRKLECEPAPMILGFILGPMMEENFRRAMVLSKGDFSVFVSQPISLGFLLAAAILLGLTMLRSFRAGRDQIAVEEG